MLTNHDSGVRVKILIWAKSFLIVNFSKNLNGIFYYFGLVVFKCYTFYGWIQIFGIFEYVGLEKGQKL